VIVLDANILLYAYSFEAPEHSAARGYLERIFAAREKIGLPLQSIAAFLRIVTHPRLGRTRISLAEAVEVVDQWLSLPQVRVLVPGESHWHILRRMLIEGHATGRLVTDAQIAAVTVEFGGELQTNDRDFARFPGLRWQNPLVS